MPLTTPQGITVVTNFYYKVTAAFYRNWNEEALRG